MLLAYTKIVVGAGDHRLLACPTTRGPPRCWPEYFPAPLRERYGDRMARPPAAPRDRHHRAGQRGGQPGRHLVRLPGTGGDRGQLRRRGARLRGGARRLRPAGAVARRRGAGQPGAHRGADRADLEIRRLLDRAVRWLVANRRSPIDVTGEIDRLRPGVQAAAAKARFALPRTGARSVRQHAAALAEQGIPESWRNGLPGSRTASACSTWWRWRTPPGRDLDEVASVYFALSDRFRVDDLLSQISALPREDRWQTLARMALRYDLYAALAALTGEVLGRVHAVRVGGGQGTAMGKVQRRQHRAGPRRDGRVRRRPGRPRLAVRTAPPDPHPGPHLRRLTGRPFRPALAVGGRPVSWGQRRGGYGGGVSTGPE